MFIQEFLREQGWKYKGSVPLVGGDLEELGKRLEQIMHVHGLLWAQLPEFSRFGLRVALGKRGYPAMEDLLQAYWEIKHKLLGGACLEIEELLLGIHDAYVKERNKEDSLPRPLFAGQVRKEGVAACRQCGECCKGPASGPLSSSPVDLALWEKLGREDLLYHTLRGAWRPSKELAEHWAACPFLRFSGRGEGVCLIHPVKPLVCREFLCGKSST